MHTCMCRKYPIIYINIQGYSKHSSYHTYTFFWKEYLHACSRYCAKITYVHILTILLPQTTHTHLKYFINIQIFVVPFIFIYTYTHIGEPISHHAHTCIWKGTFMSSTYSWGAIPHHTFIWEAFLRHSGMGTFFEKLLMLPIHKYTYLEMHYLPFIHFARYFYAIYSHTLQHIFMPYIFTHISTHHWKASPTLLRCKVPIMGQLKSLQKVPIFMLF